MYSFSRTYKPATAKFKKPLEMKTYFTKFPKKAGTYTSRYNSQAGGFKRKSGIF